MAQLRNHFDEMALYVASFRGPTNETPLADVFAERIADRCISISVASYSPLMLESKFGQFKATIWRNGRSSRLHSKMAFAVLDWPSSLSESDTSSYVSRTIDFVPRWMTFGVNDVTGSPHRLFWGIGDRSLVLTCAFPTIISPSHHGRPTHLLPISARLFRSLAN
jgi:hypothetical protein